MRILVVDDEELVRECIAALLAFDAHEVHAADCGEAALALMGRSHFDLVLLDYAMPDMKGDELAMAIRVLRPDQPIVMVTGNSPPLRALQVVDFVIHKPVMLDDLRKAIARMCPQGEIAS